MPKKLFGESWNPSDVISQRRYSHQKIQQPQEPNNLAARQHNGYMNFIAVFNPLFQFVRIGTFHIEINFNLIQKRTLFLEQCGFHGRILFYQRINTVPDGSAHHFHKSVVAGMHAMGFVNIQLDCHGSVLSLPQGCLCNMGFIGGHTDHSPGCV